MRFLVCLFACLTASTLFADDLKITVSDQLPMPIVYPAECYKMTPAEFFQWATKLNVKLKKESDERSTHTPSPYIEGTGIEGRIDPVTGGFYMNTVRRRYVNPDYYGPGPLIIVNPYCPPTR